MINYFSSRRKISLGMFHPSTITEQFEIPPSCLDKNWRTKIFQILSKKRNGKIIQNYGAVLEVKKISKIEHPRAHNSKLLSQVTYDALAFRPSVGEIRYGSITMVVKLGIIIESHSLIKVLIQLSNMPAGYEFNDNNKTYGNGIHSYGTGDMIRFKIIGARYKQNEINIHGSCKDLPVENKKEDEENYTIVEPEEEFLAD